MWNPDSEKEFNNYEELKKELDALMDFQDSALLFRGYSKNDEIYPNIMRHNLIFYEEHIIEQFLKRCTPYYSAVSLLDFIACAQHYGLYTRLLDFSGNPYIALYFALGQSIAKATSEDEKIDDTVHIIFFDKQDAAKLEFKNGIYVENETLVISDETDLYNDYKYQYWKLCAKAKSSFRLSYIDSIFSNTRMLMQQGAFVVCGIDDKGVWEDQLCKNTFHFMIHVDRAFLKDALTDMQRNSVDGFHLMPDLFGLCHTINRLEDCI